ncbi:MAG TPA: hypothetical protein VIY47_08830 [Ignavibacteriaceae bacterium]
MQKAWRDAKFPSDTDDIYRILVKHGFSDKEIKRVFDQVLGGDSQEQAKQAKQANQKVTPAVKKIAAYIKKAGLTDDIKEFMREVFGEELGLTKKPGMFDKVKKFFGKKAVAEDIRAIFTAIVKEERTGRVGLLRSYDRAHLGRNKK